MGSDVRTVVFLGPSLPREEARAILPGATFLPPASKGDVYRILPTADCIVLIDGVFHGTPSIWQRELLAAVEEGVVVIGAASMGALRAAELAAFGMIGVGKIFEDFASGALEDDDEVAVVHGPADSGYRSMGEAMVNVRATLAKARAEGIVSESSRGALELIAKDVYYMERTYPGLIERAAKAVPQSELSTLREWLPRNKVDQKRDDALAMLRRMRADLERADGAGATRVNYRLEYTTFWDQLVQSAGGVTSPSEEHDGGAITSDAILDELRLEGLAYLQAREAAMTRGLALTVAHQQDHGVDPALLADKHQAFRQERSLSTDEELSRWLRDNHLGPGQLDELVREEALLALVLGDASIPRRHIAQHLRNSGRYATLHARARDKRERLEKAGLWNAQPGQPAVGIDREGLLAWYFDLVGPLMPRDLRHHVRTLDFEDSERLVSVALREFCYRRLCDGA